MPDYLDKRSCSHVDFLAGLGLCYIEISDTVVCGYVLSLALCWNSGSFFQFLSFFFFPKIGTTTAVFTMSELMWAINTLSSLASWSWFVSELGALVLTNCRIANLYYALFLYTDFFTQDTVYIVRGMPQPHYRNALCHSPEWESACKILQDRPFPCFLGQQVFRINIYIEISKWIISTCPCELGALRRLLLDFKLHGWR